MHSFNNKILLLILVISLFSPNIPAEENNASPCPECPDQDIQALISIPVSSALMPDLFLIANKIYSTFTAKGLETKTLMAQEATKETVENYLVCPKLIAWIRIGRTLNDGSLQMGDESQVIAPMFFESHPGIFENTMVVIASTSPYNQSLELPIMKNAKAYSLMEGYGILMTGSPGPIVADYIQKVVNEDMEMSRAFEEVKVQHNLTHFSFFGTPKVSEHYFKDLLDGTAITDIEKLYKPSDFKIDFTTDERVNFSVPRQGRYTLSVYTGNGRNLMTDNLIITTRGSQSYLLKENWISKKVLFVHISDGYQTITDKIVRF